MRTVLPRRAVLIPDHAEKVFKGIIYDTYHWTQELYDGSTATFEMLKRPDTVKVIAIHRQKIVILEQEQPNQSLFYDIPGGIHDHEEEDEFVAAQRELFEETGMKFSDWKLVNIYQPHNKIEQFVYIFVASGLINQVEQRLDAGERISIRLLEFDEAKQLLDSPMGRYLPKEIEKSNSIEDLCALPEYT